MGSSEGLDICWGLSYAESNASRPPIDLTVNYFMHAGIGAIMWRLENDQPASPEQMAVWLYQFSMAAIAVS